MSSVSCGVSTAVGSSRMRTLAPRYSALRISIRCCDADRQLADLRVRVDLEAELLAELADPAVGRLRVEEDRVGHRLVAEDDVLGDGEDGDEHEVLVDHADAAGDGVGRAGDRPSARRRCRISPSSGVSSPYRMFIRVRLAGAVLAEQGVDLAGPDLEVDAVVGHHAGEALGDAAHLERRAPRRSASSDGGRRSAVGRGLGWPGSAAVIEPSGLVGTVASAPRSRALQTCLGRRG